MVKEPCTALEEFDDSILLHLTVKEKSSSLSYGEFLSEIAVVDVAEPDLINEYHPSCTVNPPPPSTSL